MVFGRMISGPVCSASPDFGRPDGEDNPQLIFESLNSRGTPLTVGDLVRNYLLIAEDRKDQERLYEEYWKPIEMMFGDDPGSERLNAGIRMWLTIRFVKERVRDKSHTYSVFKAYIEDEYEGNARRSAHRVARFLPHVVGELQGHNIMTGSKEFRSWKWAKDQAHRRSFPHARARAVSNCGVLVPRRCLVSAFPPETKAKHDLCIVPSSTWKTRRGDEFGDARGMRRIRNLRTGQGRRPHDGLRIAGAAAPGAESAGIAVGDGETVNVSKDLGARDPGVR